MKTQTIIATTPQGVIGYAGEHRLALNYLLKKKYTLF